jgi:hypothetical protein
MPGGHKRHTRFPPGSILGSEGVARFVTLGDVGTPAVVDVLADDPLRDTFSPGDEKLPNIRTVRWKESLTGLDIFCRLVC